MKFIGILNGVDCELNLSRPKKGNGNGETFRDEAEIEGRGIAISIPVSTIVEFVEEELGLDVVTRPPAPEVRAALKTSPEIERKAALVREEMGRRGIAPGRSRSPYMRTNLRIVRKAE
jgi:hypothetical protein